MTFKEYRTLMRADFYRLRAQVGWYSLGKELLFGESYKYVFWMRCCSFLRPKPILHFTLYPIARLLLKHYQYKFGYSIPFECSIGPGFLIGHVGAIVVNENVRIGKNCNISNCVTIGQSNRGDKKGCPLIGDNCYIGPGARIFGAVRIGNNVAIGANAVVTKDVQDNGVVVGVPGKVISHEGTAEYVRRTDYEDKI